MCSRPAVILLLFVLLQEISLQLLSFSVGIWRCTKILKLIFDAFTEWILEYKRKRPGLKILQERIDEFIVAHEAQQEKVSVPSSLLSSEEANKFIA
jgi:hypothetical protein